VGLEGSLLCSHFALQGLLFWGKKRRPFLLSFCLARSPFFSWDPSGTHINNKSWTLKPITLYPILYIHILESLGPLWLTPKPYILNPKPYTLKVLNPKPYTLHLIYTGPYTLNLNYTPYTLYVQVLESLKNFFFFNFVPCTLNVQVLESLGPLWQAQLRSVEMLSGDTRTKPLTLN